MLQIAAIACFNHSLGKNNNSNNHYNTGVYTYYTHHSPFRYEAMWDALYNLLVAEDSIQPEKYVVNGYPSLRNFPATHVNKPSVLTALEKSEL